MLARRVKRLFDRFEVFSSRGIEQLELFRQGADGDLLNKLQLPDFWYDIHFDRSIFLWQTSGH